LHRDNKTITVLLPATPDEYRSYLLELIRMLPLEVITKTASGWWGHLTASRGNAASQFVADFSGSYTKHAIPSVVLFDEHSRLSKQLFYAKAIIIPFQYLQEKLVAFGLKPENIVVIHPSVNATYQPLDWEEAQAIKEQTVGGTEYFLASAFTATEDTLTLLLKAFSIFKKWQQSSMKLVLHCNRSAQFQTKLESYKYRNDIVLKEPAIAAEEMAAAYAILSYEKTHIGNAFNAVKSLQSGVPFITAAHACITEIGSDIVVQVPHTTPDDIAQRMMMLYKNEALHKQLAVAGIVRAKQFSLDAAIAQLRQTLQ
jgi:hypothetical protein